MSDEVKYSVLIKNNETGEIRSRRQDIYCDFLKDKDGHINLNALTMTKDGVRCDCSRYLHFQWAENIDVPFGDPGFKCSTGKFSILSAILDDGRIIILEGDDE